MLQFSALWLLLKAVPIVHWVWRRLAAQLGLLDYAGGTVVHITAGTAAALVGAIVLGPRRGFEAAMPPHNMTMTVTVPACYGSGGTFNGGSALAADGNADEVML